MQTKHFFKLNDKKNKWAQKPPSPSPRVAHSLPQQGEGSPNGYLPQQTHLCPGAHPCRCHWGPRPVRERVASLTGGSTKADCTKAYWRERKYQGLVGERAHIQQVSPPELRFWVHAGIKIRQSKCIKNQSVDSLKNCHPMKYCQLQDPFHNIMFTFSNK